MADMKMDTIIEASLDTTVAFRATAHSRIEYAALWQLVVKASSYRIISCSNQREKRPDAVTGVLYG